MESNAVGSQVGAEASMSSVGRLIGVFTSPGRAFASIDARPGWILPMVLVVVVNLVFITTAGDIILSERLAQQEEAMLERGATQEQVDQAMEMGTKFGTVMAYVFSVVGPPIVITIIAAVFMFVGNVMLGGKATFSKIFSVTAHAWLIPALYALVLIPLILTKESTLVTLSLASLLDPEAQKTFLYKILSYVDVFYIWWVVVYGIGLGVIYRMRTQKTITAVAVVYGLYAVAASAIGSLLAG